MGTHTVAIAGNRKLIISGFGESLEPIQAPFVTLLPAFNAAERHQAEAKAELLLTLGSVALCCVGPEAEQLHDALDVIMEARGALEVVTIWHEDLADACEYFLYAAAGASATLLALIASHPKVQAILEEETRCE